jgi:hypothetical protein
MDEIERLRRAIATLWRELPALFGPDWLSLEGVLRTYLLQLMVATSTAERRQLYDQIRFLFFDHIAADERLRRLLARDQATEELATRAAQTAAEETAITAPPPVNQTVTRYSDVLAPTQVPIAQRFAIIVGLTDSPAAGDDNAQAMTVQVGQSIQVVLTTAEPAATLEVLGERRKHLVVQAEQASEPAVFYLVAHQPGSYVIQIDYWYGGQIVATYQRTVAATPHPVPNTTVSSPALALRIGSGHAPYPDVIIRITTGNNQLRYDLHFADTHFVSLEGPPLRIDPEQYRAELMTEIEGLRNDAHKYEGYVLRELTKIGQRLYRDLFPVELRREYRRFRQTVRTLQIISDEPWIPWELLKPYDSEDPAQVVDDDFLCLQYEFARWFTPALPPAPAIAVQNLAAITPHDCDLPSAHAEHDMVRGFAVVYGMADHTPATATLPIIEQLLGGETPIHLWHFACHGHFRPDAPNRSALQLAENAELRPDDLVGPVETRLRTDRPLVFLNACRVGALGLSLTGLGGWAKVLIHNCGVGALIAPLWEVNDRLAHDFSTAFYQALVLPNTTLAQAVQHARQVVKAQSPHDPVWLAYSVYAHPNAQVALGNGVTP